MSSHLGAPSRSRSRGVIPAPGTLFDRPEPLRVVLLGATGSIGTQTVDVVRRNPGKVELVAVAANSNVVGLVELAREFPSIKAIALGDVSRKDDPWLSALPAGVSASFGPDAVDELAAFADCDCVLNALVGASGMRASFNALSAGHELALANKESLVIAGDLIMPLARPGKVFPVDSEHSAIFQCFVGEDPWEASRIWLTASGGPFFGRSRDELRDVTPQTALKHPNWTMGAKVTIDSSTLVNKGLEAIEAHHLFDAPYEMIRICVQRQSAVHSMVEYADGSVIAHMGATDMRVPIQYALSYPRRWPAPCAPIEFPSLARVTFDEPDRATFGALDLVIDSGRRGGILPCVMNAADEVAVDAFLKGHIPYLGIQEVISSTLALFDAELVESLDQLAAVDSEARSKAAEVIRTTSR